MKKPRIDILLLVLALALVFAILMTIAYGRKNGSRHGYGQNTPTLESFRHTYGAPRMYG